MQRLAGEAEANDSNMQKDVLKKCLAISAWHAAKSGFPC
jgi:hypothetical protein